MHICIYILQYIYMAVYHWYVRKEISNGELPRLFAECCIRGTCGAPLRPGPFGPRVPTRAWPTKAPRGPTRARPTRAQGPHKGPAQKSPAHEGPGAPTKAQPMRAQGGRKEPGPPGPRGAHKGPAHLGPGEVTRVRPTRAHGSHKGPAHKGPG